MLLLRTWSGERQSVMLRVVILVVKRPSAGGIVELEVEELS